LSRKVSAPCSGIPKSHLDQSGACGNRIAHHEAILTSRNEVYTGFIDHPAMTLPAILECVPWVSPPTADWLRMTTRYYHQAIALLAEVAGSGMVR
jgi:hypothetical protein